MTIPVKKWNHYWELRKRGFSIARSARESGISYNSARAHEKAAVGNGEKVGAANRAAKAPEPIAIADLAPEPKRALEDFAYFQKRYFGRIPTPWQVEAAELVIAKLESPDKEFGVVNAPPGCGKSTTFTLDIPAWATVRNRSIRGMIGSKVETSAARYVQRLRRAFERDTPILGEAEQVARGLALDAESTLQADFGVFRPLEFNELWSAKAFVVRQHGHMAITEKEPTWSAYGMDSGFLGMRYDLIIWDDLVDKLVMRTAESRENQQEWYDDVAEKRLEPAGLLLLQGQRMGPDDLYRYALDKRAAPEDDDADDGESEPAETSQKYFHVTFKAHYAERCHDEHRKDAPYYPDGCLLDPRRLPWRELKAEMANPRGNFEVIYQQNDVDPEGVLVDPQWITGGTDPSTHVVFPGCRDKDRDVCELPGNLAGDLISVATSDPSPTKWWVTQWWIVRCADGRPHERYLMDLERRYMDAPSFLDWSESTRSFSGLMEEWQSRSADMGLPISTWIVEANAAQRFLLQFEHVRRWLADWRVDLIPHQTARNKSDPEYGVQTMAGTYKHGLVRLPWKGHPGRGWTTSQKLVAEVTHWPAWSTEDCVMAQWFLEWHLPHLVPAPSSLPRSRRPSWLRGADTWGWRRKTA